MGKVELRHTVLTVVETGEKINVSYMYMPEGVIYYDDGGNMSTYRMPGVYAGLGIPYGQATILALTSETAQLALIGLGRESVIFLDNYVDDSTPSRSFKYPNNAYFKVTKNGARYEIEFFYPDGTRAFYSNKGEHRYLPMFFTTSAMGTRQETILIDFDYNFTSGRPKLRINTGTGISTSTYFPSSQSVKPEQFLATMPTFEDPYTPGGTTEEGGGNGNFTNTTTPVDFPSLPTVSPTDAGFITLYSPTPTELENLGSYMWTNSAFDPSSWKKLFANPMDAIIGLSLVPVSIPSSGSHTVNVGNLSTGISMHVADTQYVELDCGSITIPEYWGSYLDYEPYTKIEIYLPYVGMHSLSADEVIGKNISIKYHIDVLSGACVCYVKCGDSVLYSFSGNCACPIPITGNDWGNVINTSISVASSIGTTIATGGATAPITAGVIASSALTSGSMKPSIERSGSLSGSSGYMGIQIPYVIITRPRQALPDRLNTFTGYPSFITSILSDVTGYTEIDKIHLTGISATDEELAEIETLLKGGVIL